MRQRLVSRRDLSRTGAVNRVAGGRGEMLLEFPIIPRLLAFTGQRPR